MADRHEAQSLGQAKRSDVILATIPDRRAADRLNLPAYERSGSGCYTLPSEWRECSHTDVSVAFRGGPLVGYQGSLRQAAALIPVQPGDRVLEIGVGTGNFARLVAERGLRIWGIDPSEEMLARCREMSPAFSLAVGGFGAVPVSTGQFDAVISSFAFHETPPSKRQDALNEVVRVLRPGGCLVLLDIIFASKEAESEAAQLSVAWDEAEDYPLVGDLDRMLGVAGGQGIRWTQTPSCHWVVSARRGE